MDKFCVKNLVSELWAVGKDENIMKDAKNRLNFLKTRYFAIIFRNQVQTCISSLNIKFTRTEWIFFAWTENLKNLYKMDQKNIFSLFFFFWDFFLVKWQKRKFLEIVLQTKYNSKSVIPSHSYISCHFTQYKNHYTTKLDCVFAKSIKFPWEIFHIF